VKASFERFGESLSKRLGERYSDNLGEKSGNIFKK
jgi:hypothetical protein